MSEDKYTYRVVTKDDRQTILEYLVKYFKKEEPLNRASGISDKKYLMVTEYIVDDCLKQPLSTVVECKETGDIAAVLLNSIFLRSDEKHNIDIGDDESPAGSTLVWILNELHNSFFDLAPEDVKKVIHMEFISVRTPHQHQGIASKLMSFSYPREKLEKLEIDGIMSETTSLANQTLQAKHGYKTLKEIRLADIKDKEGNQILRPDDGTEKAVLNWIPTKDL